jgi:hypothetical protein
MSTPRPSLAPSRLRGLLELHAELPGDAQRTGYQSNGVELYVSPSDQDTAIYLVGDDAAERWPRSDPMTLCA